jgi:hypothetical protein
MAGIKPLSMIEQDDVVERIAQGQKLSEIAALYRIKLNDFKRLASIDAPFQERINQAFQTAVECALEEIPEIIQREEPSKAKLLAEHARWMAAKRYREVYGEKIEMNVNNKIDLSDVLTDMQERVARIPTAYLTTDIVITDEQRELEELLK